MPPPPSYNAPTDYYSQYGSTPYGGVNPIRVPGLNLGQPGGPIEGLAQSILPMIADMLRNQFGGAAFTFGSDMNIMSARMAQQFLQQVNQARALGAKTDEPQIRGLMTGLARMIGHNVADPSVQAMVGRMSGDISGMLPFLAAAFPDQVDRWLPRGSMAVASGSFVSAGRFVIDPATGLPVSTDPMYGSRIVGELLNRGPQATSGLGAGRLGQTFEQLVARGMVASGADLRDQVAMGELFGGVGVGMSGDRARNIQGDRIRKQLEDYSKVVSAINDIFTDAGRPNTPIGELFAGLERLTVGGFSTMNAETMARNVRMSQAVAQTTGMGLEAQSAIAGQIASGLMAGGRGPGIAAYASQYTALLGRTYSDIGLVGGGPEGQSAGDILGRRAGLITSGMTSDSTRIGAAVVALGSRSAEGSPLRLVSDAIRNRQRTVTLPDGTTVDVLRLNPEQINALATRSGLGAGALQRQLMADSQITGVINATESLVDWYNPVSQELEARQVFMNALAYGPSKITGLDPSKLDEVYQALIEQQALGRYDNTDAGLVQAAVASGRLKGLSSSQLDELTTAVGSSFRGGHRGLSDVNPLIRARTAREMDLVRARSRVMAEAAWRGRGGIARHISNAVNDWGTGMGDSLIRAALVGVGMVRYEDVADSIYQAFGGDPTISGYLGKWFGIDMDQNPRALGAGVETGGIMGGLRNRPAPLAGGRVGSAPGDRSASVAIEIHGATVTIDQASGTVSISGGGAIRTGSK